MTKDQMFKLFKNYFEIRIAAILFSIIAGLYLLGIVWGLIASFADIFLVLAAAWFLAFILEPFVNNLGKKGLSRIWAALIVYFIISIFIFFIIYLILPLTIYQLSNLALTLPSLLNNLPFGTARFQDFLTNTLTNSVAIASSLASFLFYLFIILILSFYFLIDRRKISGLILSLSPEEFKNGLRFLNRLISTSIAGYVRVQLIFGAIAAIFTAILLFILGVKFTLSAAFLTGIFTVIPAVGPILAIFPPILAALFENPDKAIIAGIVSFLFQQFEFNILGPKLMGGIMKIHPIVVILSFIIGFKIAGMWGAVFSLPVASIISFLGTEVIKYWMMEKENVTKRVREATRG